MTATPRRLLLTGPRTITLEPIERGPLRTGQVRLKTLYSGISHGTEMVHYRGLSSSEGTSFDPQRRVFRSGGGAPPVFPMAMGYELVSEVIETAPDVTAVGVGDIVHTDGQHAEETVIDVDAALGSSLYPLVKLPSALAPSDALYISLGTVALQAVHDARIKVGDSVAVFGLGAVGLMTVQLARRNGAGWIGAVDPIAERRALAEGLGVSVALDPADGGVAVKEHAPRAEDVPAADMTLPGPGVDVALETSGTYAGLHEAIRSVAVGGRVVAVGFYAGDASPLRLGDEWHHNRPELISSMGVIGCPHRDYPQWGRRRMVRTVTELLDSGSLDVSSFPGRSFPFDDAADAYEFVDAHSAGAIKVALEYES